MVKGKLENVLERWGTYITDGNIEWSRKYKEKADQLFTKQLDHHWREKYRDLSTRHRLLIQDFEGMKKSLSVIEPFASASENAHLYFYYYFTGTMKYVMNQMTEAINYYKKAEKYLHEARDTGEAGELY